MVLLFGGISRNYDGAFAPSTTGLEAANSSPDSLEWWRHCTEADRGIR
jgi:hypothetical protein